MLRLALSYLPPVALGSILYQSAALSLVYNASTFWSAFYAYILSRGLQFSVVLVLEVAVLYLLLKTKIFNRIGLWPPVKRRSNDNDC